MNDTVIMSLATIASALAGLLIRYAFKSKCSDVSVCGYLNVHRDTKLETPDEKSPQTPPTQSL